MILQEASYNQRLHFYTILAVIVTTVLIYAGGLVTTLGAGLAVPDWPLSFGSLNPDGWWRQPMVREEHGHRLIGSLVGVITLVLALWVFFSPKVTKNVRFSGIAALVIVITQGILGGLRVLEKNTVYAMLHGGLAQIFFCTLLTISWMTSKSWLESSKDKQENIDNNYVLLAFLVFMSVIVQSTLGIIMRHSGAGMAIPTFPLVDGGLFPSTWNIGVSLHYAHRVWAMVVLALAIYIRVLVHRCKYKEKCWFQTTAKLTVGLITMQIMLGGLVIWTGRSVIPTTVHVLLGVFILGSSFSTFLWLFHFRRLQAI